MTLPVLSAPGAEISREHLVVRACVVSGCVRPSSSRFIETRGFRPDIGLDGWPLDPRVWILCAASARVNVKIFYQATQYGSELVCGPTLTANRPAPPLAWPYSATAGALGIGERAALSLEPVMRIVSMTRKYSRRGVPSAYKIFS